MPSVKASLTHTVYQRLRSDLLACRFPAGKPLRIIDLCETFSVSQGAIREALSRLTAEGLVESEPQRGFRVAPLSAEDLLELTKARLDIENLCLRNAIATGTLEWEGNIMAAFHQLSQTPWQNPHNPHRFSDPFMAAHQAFLDAVISACDNRWLMHVRNVLRVQAERYQGFSAPQTILERNIIGDLRDVMDSTIARDVERATTLLGAYIMETVRVVIERMDTDGLDALKQASQPPDITR